jgi:hypothetical protein
MRPMLAGAACLVSSDYTGAVGVRSVVGGHPNLPADGQEEDPMAITECHQIRQSTHRNTAPNADFVRMKIRQLAQVRIYRSPGSARRHRARLGTRLRHQPGVTRPRGVGRVGASPRRRRPDGGGPVHPVPARPRSGKAPGPAHQAGQQGGRDTQHTRPGDTALILADTCVIGAALSGDAPRSPGHRGVMGDAGMSTLLGPKEFHS